MARLGDLLLAAENFLLRRKCKLINVFAYDNHKLVHL